MAFVAPCVSVTVVQVPVPCSVHLFQGSSSTALHTVGAAESKRSWIQPHLQARKRRQTRQAHSIHPTQMWLLPGENSTPAHLSVSVCWKAYAPTDTAPFCYCKRKPLPLNLFWEQEWTCENSAQAVLQHKGQNSQKNSAALTYKSSHVRYFINSFFRTSK